ncbi:hypothetical protein ACU4GI_46875 (plasmid) [Cupriavidus basilensis]
MRQADPALEHAIDALCTIFEERNIVNNAVQRRHVDLLRKPPRSRATCCQRRRAVGCGFRSNVITLAEPY